MKDSTGTHGALGPSILCRSAGQRLQAVCAMGSIKNGANIGEHAGGRGGDDAGLAGVDGSRGADLIPWREPASWPVQIDWLRSLLKQADNAEAVLQRR